MTAFSSGSDRATACEVPLIWAIVRAQVSHDVFDARAGGRGLCGGLRGRGRLGRRGLALADPGSGLVPSSDEGSFAPPTLERSRPRHWRKRRCRHTGHPSRPRRVVACRGCPSLPAPMNEAATEPERDFAASKVDRWGQLKRQGPACVSRLGRAACHRPYDSKHVRLCMSMLPEPAGQMCASNWAKWALTVGGRRQFLDTPYGRSGPSGWWWGAHSASPSGANVPAPSLALMAIWHSTGVDEMTTLPASSSPPPRRGWRWCRRAGRLSRPHRGAT
jgi:hypothetical protein